MNPQNIPTWAESINWGIENTWWLKKLQKNTRLALSGVALAVLQACAPAQAADNPQDKAQVIKVADNKATSPTIDTVISPGETGGSLERLISLDEILEAGKIEWMENASEKYGDRTERAWEWLVRTISKEGQEELSPWTIKKLQTYTPNMLIQFANVDKDIYPKLHSMWQAEESWKRAEESWKELEEEKQRTRKSELLVSN